ncbi:glycosyltransferase family 2 protein [Methylovorus sp. MP688]|uniref:glycosyltransferase family 2 protein n=1 Tax=Methylovorus sp. (strain MP688) TaxID=887061 RepID=UPI0001EC481A|nr:glycosyltransferase family 2 protein [Methylovorus sp. MP688]ADQ84984.1 glycosyl transferase family 2 [Methylovorus sp. MP688]
MWIVSAVFLLVLLLLSIPVLVFLIQVVASFFLHESRQGHSGKALSIAVLVPAHNEGENLLPTLHSLQQQLKPQDQLIVIADNCSDDTAQQAQAAGAHVLVRQNETLRGKGYALDHGVRYLESHTRPEVVIVVDADCLLKPRALEVLAQQAFETQKPVQALYRMYSPQGAGLKTRIAEFAWEVKNYARASGYLVLGLPCQLMGTGMAFPWALIQQANLASGHIVEDLKLGLELASAGKAPLFCPEAEVTSVFPLNNEGLKTQRTRWEHGHLGMIVKEAPAMIFRGLVTLNPGLLALSLDMAVPPLALLTLLVTAIASLSITVLIFSTGLMPWVLGPVLFVLLGIGVFLAWLKYGRHILSLSNLAYAPLYALAKIPLYVKFLIKRQVNWVRSKRD